MVPYRALSGFFSKSDEPADWGRDVYKRQETTKSGREHGIGLNNIRRVARMYMGDISLEQGNEEVILSIMMQVE